MTKIVGITAQGVELTLSEWNAETARFHADAWMKHFGDRIGNGTAVMPDGSWVDLSQFAILRVEE